MTKKGKRLYVVCDITNNELPVLVGTINEIADFFNTSIACVYCKITRKVVSENKYMVLRVD